jgi:hypothetical protein
VVGVGGVGGDGEADLCGEGGKGEVVQETSFLPWLILLTRTTSLMAPSLCLGCSYSLECGLPG